MSIEFTVPGNPVGKARPRVTRYGTYTPKKTKDYEELVKVCFNRSQASPEPYGGLVCVIAAKFSVPDSYRKSEKRRLPGTPYLHKPDADNVAKAVLDALNGIAFSDDSQITELHVYKQYSAGAGNVQVQIHKCGESEGSVK